MKYIYGIFIGIITLVALVWVIHLGISGKPLAKIKLSEFQSTKEAADAVFMRLRQELKDHPIVFLGVDPEEPEHLQIWREFLKEVKEPGWKFDEIYIESGLEAKEAWGLGEQQVDIKEKESEFKQLWSEQALRGKRVAVVVPHVYSSQLIQNNPVQRIKSNPQDLRIISISIVPLAQSPKDPEVLRLPCASEGSDYTGKSPLGCAIRNKAMFWTKAPSPKASRLGILEQFGLSDYLFFFLKK